MATLSTVRLNKSDSPNWGFRLQGGKDFGTPLVIQKVNGGSPAERAGLIAGDAVIRINNIDVFNLVHKDAQDVIVRAGPSFEMVIQRGGSTWKPSVIPTGSFPKSSPSVNNTTAVTKTSLAASKTDNIGSIGTGHNLAAKPFASQVNGTSVNENSPKLINKQYNSPLKLYSEDAIAETISAQSEVLSTGALGVNFKKNEKNYDSTNSAVYRMLKEAEKEPSSTSSLLHESVEPDSGIITAPNKALTGLRHVEAPQHQTRPSGNPQLPPGQNVCVECERLIVGVFVRIKDKNLHVECFKCATCGSSLKNVGYYNINQKLYCDIHAKAAALAINNPTAVPLASPRAPVSAISSALSQHSLPSSSGPLSPKTPSFAPSASYPSSASGIKPFSSVSAPLSPGGTLIGSKNAPLTPSSSNFNKAPLSPPTGHSYGSYSPASTVNTTNIIWPPPQEDADFPTACPLFYPPPSKVEVELEEKKTTTQKKHHQGTEFEREYFSEEVDNMDETLSFYSEEMSSFTGRRSATECAEMLSDTLDTQKLVENVLKTTSPISKLEDFKRPTEYEPNTVECHLKSIIENSVPQKWESQLTQAFRTTAADHDTFSRIPSRTHSSPMVSALSIAPSQPFSPLPHSTLDPVPLPEETVPYFPPEHPLILQPPKEEEQENKKKEKPPKPYSPFVKALEIAPERPFTPVGGTPVPAKRKIPKDPLDKLLEDLPIPNEKVDMRTALTTASDRCFTPLIPDVVDPATNQKAQKPQIDKSQLQRALKPEELPASFKMNVKEPKPPSYYAPSSIEQRIQCAQETLQSLGNKECICAVKEAPSSSSCNIIEQRIKKSSEESSMEASKSTETKMIEKETIQSAPEVSHYFTPEFVPNSAQATNFAPLFQGFTCSFKNKTDHSQFSVEVSTTPPVPTPSPNPPQTPQMCYVANVIEKPASTITREKIIQENQQQKSSKEIHKQAEEVIQVRPVSAASILHKPQYLPSYQQELKATAEAELILMEKKRNAEERLKRQQEQRHQEQQVLQEQRHQEQKVLLEQRHQEQQVLHEQRHQEQQVLNQTKPVIKIEASDENHHMEKNFTHHHHHEERPQSTTFSPRPRSVTPSMINKAPPLLPYYQDNLVPHYHDVIETNLFDPTRPEISRSPSPLPGGGKDRSRSSSPFPGQNKPRIERAKSPAEGPPPNPLFSSKPLPNPQDSRVQVAKESLQNSLEHYKTQRDVIEQQRGMEFFNKRNSDEVTTNSLFNQNVAYPVKESQFDVRTGSVQHVKHRLDDHHQRESKEILNIAATEGKQSTLCQDGNRSLTKTDISKKSLEAHLGGTSKSQSNSTEVSADGLTQVQRRKIVTEEFEHSHKENNIQIEKSCITTKPFARVNVSNTDSPHMQNFHITNPHHIKSLDTQQTLLQASEKLNNHHQVQLPLPPAPPPPPPPQPPMRKVFPPGSLGPVKHVVPPKLPSENVTKPFVPKSDIGAGAGRQTGGITATPKRGKGLLNTAALPGSRVALCGQCHGQIRGPFITALGKIWCPHHFVCATASCKRPLQDLGFVEENGQLYCEYCFEQYLAPNCAKCNAKVKADCLKAIGKNFHPECFNCTYCGKLFGNNPFFLEDGSPYCEADWNELFTTKCYACGFPVEAGDRWVEALNNNYHSQCFNCTMCKKNLEGQSFFAKSGRPYCKAHAR